MGEHWPLSPDAPMNHQSLQERQATCKTFLEIWPAFAELLNACYVDDMDDQVTNRHGLWPDRSVLLEHGKVVWTSTLSEEPQKQHDELLAVATKVSTSSRCQR